MAKQNHWVLVGRCALTLSLITPSLHCIKSATNDPPADAGTPAAQVIAQESPPLHAAPALAVPTPTLREACREICEPSDKLKCKNSSDCLPNCIAMATTTPCAEEMSAFYACLKGRSLQNWECAEDGVAAIRPGICDSEQGKAVGCMEEKMHN